MGNPCPCRALSLLPLDRDLDASNARGTAVKAPRASRLQTQHGRRQCSPDSIVKRRAVFGSPVLFSTKRLQAHTKTRVSRTLAHIFVKQDQASLAKSDSASTISGIPGVGEMPSSAGSRTARASAGRFKDSWSLANDNAARRTKLRAR
jgi:hypothetical protein